MYYIFNLLRCFIFLISGALLFSIIYFIVSLFCKAAVKKRLVISSYILGGLVVFSIFYLIVDYYSSPKPVRKHVYCSAAFNCINCNEGVCSCSYIDEYGNQQDGLTCANNNYYKEAEVSE